MKNIILPEFYFQDNLNRKFSYLIEKFPEYFNFKIKIESEEGSYPYTFWNGEGNNNLIPNTLPPFANYEIVNDTLKKNNKVGLNLANPFLQEKDIKNNSELNTMLKILENGSNYLILNNISFGKILKEKYPLFYQVYVLSENIPEDFYRIKIPYYLLKDFEYIPKNKIDVVLPVMCNENCDSFKKEKLSQYLFSRKTLCLNCQNKLKTDFSMEIEALSKQGYQYFSFNNQGINKNNNEIFSKLLCDTFIKKEFYFQVLYFLEKK